MFITDGKNIRIPRGDTATIPFTFVTEDEGEESPYIFTSGQYAELSVYHVKGAEAVFTKTAARSAQHADGTVFISFNKAETSIRRGKYIYAVRLLKEDGTSADTWLGGDNTAEFEIM